MKKEGKGRKGNFKKNHVDAFADTELGNDEYGFEYDFFITKNNNFEKNLSSLKRKKPEKGEDTQNQSKTFFLPDFFIHED